jgi:hypothetical protein
MSISVWCETTKKRAGCKIGDGSIKIRMEGCGPDACGRGYGQIVV